MNAGRMQYALARHFDWMHNTMMPQWFIDGGIADLLFVSRAGYVTEIEIKISASDWNADQKKWKWQRERPNVARFFYAIPESLVDKIPAWLPESSGILVVNFSKIGYDQVRELRSARRFKANKLPQKELNAMFVACYNRFWNAEMRRRRPA